MIVSGPDLRMVEAIAGSVECEAIPIGELELGPLLGRGRLDLVLVDRLARPAEAAAPDTAPPIERAIRVASAAGVRKLVLVTSRPSADPLLSSLRRSGVPYDIVRVGRLLEIEPGLEGRRVIASAELIEATREAVPIAEVIEAVKRALARPSAGATLEVEPVAEALSRLGIEIAAGGWRAAWWKLLGRPSLRIAESGMIELVGRSPETAVTEPAPVLAGSLGTGGWP